MPILFGPVLSRRLGRSLGIDLVFRKVCSMDCLYCEVGRTTYYTSERKPYISLEKIREALEQAKKIANTYDVLTITGSGEPTLNIHFEEAVHLAKAMIDKPIAVLTNSTLVHERSVREALAKVDFVLASLDSAREKSFRLVNRPVAAVKLDLIIEGLSALRQEMEGELWLEVLFVKGLNDTPEDISALKSAIDYIKPHRVQLNTVVRPPAYPMARPLSLEELEAIKQRLSGKAEIISAEKRGAILEKPLTLTELSEWLINYLSRRPADLEELALVFGEAKDKLLTLLNKLQDEGKVTKVYHEGKVYFRA
ncbi:MAG: radical SAM protein [Thermodesulfobacterium sp.]|nr:radical SAM protein [Thermodesulfobacterium sp.]